MKSVKLTSIAALVLSAACTPAPLPPSVTQADAVADSEAAGEAKELAPQAHAAAEKLRAEAAWLHEEGRLDEAEIAGEQALAAYNEAFALARAARAEQRLEKAKEELNAAKSEVARLDALQAQIAADADAFEMRARVHLDTEEVKDVSSMTPERAKARRLAAKRLTAEANLLCLATRLLNNKAPGLTGAEGTVDKLSKELNHGSIKDDLYPRAATARATCLKQLTLVRRPTIKKAPESSSADKLLKSLSETGTLFAYRDDRGVVVNLASPVDKDGKLTEAAVNALKILGGTAKAHKTFPLLLVTHTAKSGQEKRAEELSGAALDALKAAGAPQATVRTVLNAQPVVSPRVGGSAAKNERIEIVFVVPGR